jgi:hypothetical protein
MLKTLGLIVIAALAGCSEPTREPVSLTLPAPKATPDPITSQIDFKDLDFTMPATIDGKPVRITFDPGDADTTAWNVPKGVSTLTLSNGQSMKIDVSKTYKGPTDTLYLGYDDLRHSAVGFDIYKGLICFWPYGVTDGDFWIKDQESDWPTPNGTLVANLASVKGGMGIPGEVQGHSKVFKFHPAVAQTCLAGVPETGTYLLPDLSIGQNNEGWLTNLFGSLSVKADIQPYNGELTLENFYSQRVLLDLANDKIIFSHYADNDRLTTLLNMITRSNVGIDDSGCIVKGINMPKDLASSAGMPVDNVAGIPGSKIAQALRNPTPESTQVLQHLVAATRHEYVWETLLPNGQKRKWSVPAQ